VARARRSVLKSVGDERDDKYFYPKGMFVEWEESYFKLPWIKILSAFTLKTSFLCLSLLAAA
jgi:hypothetical protein